MCLCSCRDIRKRGGEGVRAKADRLNVVDTEQHAHLDFGQILLNKGQIFSIGTYYLILYA